MLIAKCLNCNRDYDQETCGAICPHDVGGPNSLPHWPKLQPFPEIWAVYEAWCKSKGRHALHGDLWQGFLAGVQFAKAQSADQRSGSGVLREAATPMKNEEKTQ